MRRTERPLAGIVIAGGLVVGLAVGWSPLAQAATADRLVVQAELDSQGRLSVNQTFTLAESAAVSTLVQDIPSRLDLDGQRYSFQLSQIQATADGVDVAPTVTPGSGSTKVTVPVDQATEVVISYQVSGATRSTAHDRVDLTWLLVGGLNLDVSEVSGRVEVPPGAINYDCQSGVVGALTTCSTYTAGTHDDWALRFTQRPLAQGNVVQAEVLFPAGIVETTNSPSGIWSMGKAFTPGGSQLGVTGLVLLVGGLGLFALWRRIRTAGYRGSPVVVARFVRDDTAVTGFEVDPDITPAMVGTLVDGRVEPPEVVATVLDLAVRGHVRISEVVTGDHCAPDWVLTRLSCSDELRGFEKVLLEGLVSGSGRVSGLSPAVSGVVDRVQAGVLDEVVRVGWFSRWPSRGSWSVVVGWVGVLVSLLVLVGLVVWSSFGLVGLALVSVAVVGLVVLSQVRPVTVRGAAVFAGLRGLGEDLHGGVSPGGGYGVVSRVLPYAVVLGGWDRWVSAMVAADDDGGEDSMDLSWYHGPSGWHMSDLPASLDAFITVVTGRLFTRA